MDAPRRPDPEFDALAGTVRPRDFEPAESQRLVVNPFLAVLGLMGWWWAARWLLLRGPFPPLAVAWVGGLALLPRSIQFHCLDCGGTGAYPRRELHACSAVLARRERRGRVRWPVPSARAQLVAWAYLIGSVALLLVVAGAGPGGR